MSRPSNTRQAYPCATPVYPRPIEDVAGGGDHHTCLQHSVLHRTLPVEGKAGAGARAESTLMRTTLSTQQRLLRSGGGGGATPGPVVLRGGAGAPAVRQCTADQARVAEDLARLRRVAAGGAAVRRVVPCLHAQQQLHPHPHHGHCQQRLQRTAAVSAARLSKMLTEGGGVLDESGGGVGGAGAVSDDGSGDEVDVDGSAGAAAGAPAGPLPAYRPPLLVRMEGELCRALGEVNTRHRGQPYLLPASAVETRGTSAAPAPAGRKRGESGGGDGDGGVVGYRRGRLAAFRRVMRRFQRNFKSYRPILAATFAEYDGAVAAFCAERAADEARLARRAAEVAGLEERLAEAEAAATVELRVKKRELVAGQRALARARAEAAEADGAAAALARRAEAAEAHAAEVEEEKAVFQERCLQLERRVLAMQSEHSADLTARQCGAVEKATRDAQAAEEQAENLARENKALAGKVLALEAVQANMVSERDLLVDSSVRTPRPDWHESPIADCFTYTDSTQSTVFAAAEQVLELEHQLLELRQSEALFTRKWFVGFGGGKGDTNGGGAAAADGAASSSPAFLHHSGRLRNMNLRKPAVEQLVVQFWRERHTALGERRLLSPGEFLLDFLERKHGAGRAMEWAYNVWYGLQRYRADPDCDLFFGILSGRVAEGVWAEERLQLDKLRDALIDLDSANRGVLTPAQIIQAVGDVFPGKSEQSLRALRALVGAGGCGEVAYITLFDDDDECFQAPVVEALRRQNTAEREEYVRELLDAVLSIARRQGAAEITRGVVLAAFSTVDPYGLHTHTHAPTHPPTHTFGPFPLLVLFVIFTLP